MFLFSTSPSPETKAVQPASTPVLRAIQDGAQRSGTSFDFLVRTAQRESALDPNAKAGTSSATGLFQFLDQTWLATLKGQGAQHGLGDFAGAITQGSDGRLSVADPALRQQILEMRRDPAIASVMAGEFTQKNREQLKSVIGRDPTGGELYVAHVLGARGASELIKTIQADPDRAAMKLFPEAAAANKPIFFDRAGKARSVTEVFGVLAAAHDHISVAAPASQVQGEAPLAALSPARQKGLIGLFSTEGSREPISEAVTRHWGAGRKANGQVQGGQVRLASLDRGASFFPRADAPATELASLSAPGEAAQRVSTPPGITVLAPVPPARPDGLAAATTSAVGTTAKAKRKQGQLPFDLTRFQKPGARL
jgi:hypothetical protein